MFRSTNLTFILEFAVLVAFLTLPTGGTKDRNKADASGLATDVLKQHNPLSLRGLYAREKTPDGRRLSEEDAPEQIHIALAVPRPREKYAMSISWLTWTNASSYIYWGRNETNLASLATGGVERYSIQRRGHVEYESGLLHSGTLEELNPSTEYFYACGDPDVAMSTVRSFRTPPPVRQEEAVTIGVLGDLGQTNDSEQTASAVLLHTPVIDLVLHAGDLAYADCEHDRWDSYARMLDPMASRVPWMVAAGNHEIESGDAEVSNGPFAAYEARFAMPSSGEVARGWDCGVGGGLNGNQTVCGVGVGDDVARVAARKATKEGLEGDGVALAARRARESLDLWGPGVVVGIPASTPGDDVDGGNDNSSYVPRKKPPQCCPSEFSGTYDYGNSFYSFDVASVHVVVLNPYAATGEGSTQHTWLLEDLETTNRSLTPWVVAMMHCPWYNSNLEHQGERQAATAMRVMEPVLYEHKTALVIAGHVHAYERSYPVFEGELTDDGPSYVVVGATGNREQHDPEYYRMPDWSAFRNGSAFGLGVLSVKNSSKALWEWKSNEDQPFTHDSAWITNPYNA